ncbi:hypothetical protein PIB30_054141 [Stylosanthes scabra]|uniref:Uncharacterized protein n=1 Tax=Stylosanthes scabra TaxID=79078 RepID=A0ABU6YHI8_9FABA|nr:hypothetical protein [Stylosanthes scabra]
MAWLWRGPLPLTPSPTHLVTSQTPCALPLHASATPQRGIDKEKKLGAKLNLKEKKQVKIHGILRIGYRYPATWYRYPRVQACLDHAMAWARRDPRPKTAPLPCPSHA